MPNDVKAAVSAITLAVALVLAFWSGSPIRHDFASFVVIVAVFMIAAMWVFPEAGGKKRNPKGSGPNGTKAAP
jgi:cell division protein FtsW (lipid II flippase)